MKNLPKPKNNSLYKNALTCDWDINQFIKELQKRSIEHSLGIDILSEETNLSFNIRFRKKDRELIKALLRSLFGTLKQG